MEATALISEVLPGEPELKAFARAASRLLIDPAPRAPGARAVARRAGVGLQPFDHRDYAPGDEVRHIDWRQTARARRTIVRRFESEAVSDWTLVLDASSSMASHDAAKWHAAVRLAAGLSYALLGVGHRVAVLAFGSQVLAECAGGRGQHHYAAIARLLAGLRPAAAGQRSDLGACAHRLHGAPSVLTLSDGLTDDEMRHGIVTLRQRSSALHLLQLGDAADTRLPAGPELELVDVETGARRPIRAGPQSEALATERRVAMSQRLRDFCARSGVAFSHADVTCPWQAALLAHLLQAQRRC